MKNLDLQLFADDNAGATGAGGAAPGTTDTAEKGKNENAAADQKQGAAATEKPGEQKAKYTDADVDEILNKKFAKWQAQQEKAVSEAKKLAEMNATQKAEYQRDQLQKEVDELKKQAAISEMMKTSRKMLSDSGITVPDELLSVLVTENAEETKAAVDSFAKAFKDALEAEVKNRLKGEPPRKGIGGAAPMTKEQIMAIKDPELRQKKMLENRELFNI